jgi:hypothetical protein
VFLILLLEFRLISEGFDHSTLTKSTQNYFLQLSRYKREYFLFEIVDPSDQFSSFRIFLKDIRAKNTVIVGPKVRFHHLRVFPKECSIYQQCHSEYNESTRMKFPME